MPTPGTLDPQKNHWKCQSPMSLETKKQQLRSDHNTAIFISQTTAGQLAISNKNIAIVKHWQTPGKKHHRVYINLYWMQLILKGFQVDGNWKNPDAEAPRLPSVVGRAGPLSKRLLAGRHFVRSHWWFGSVFLAAFFFEFWYFCPWHVLITTISAFQEENPSEYRFQAKTQELSGDSIILLSKASRHSGSEKPMVSGFLMEKNHPILDSQKTSIFSIFHAKKLPPGFLAIVGPPSLDLPTVLFFGIRKTTTPKWDLPMLF